MLLSASRPLYGVEGHWSWRFPTSKLDEVEGVCLPILFRSRCCCLSEAAFVPRARKLLEHQPLEDYGYDDAPQWSCGGTTTMLGFNLCQNRGAYPTCPDSPLHRFGQPRSSMRGAECPPGFPLSLVTDQNSLFTNRPHLYSHGKQPWFRAVRYI